MKFRRLFRVPFVIFLDLVKIANPRWWCTWTPDKVNAAGCVVSNLELRILGALFVLGSVRTKSEEVHRDFFLEWVSKMASIKPEFIYMPEDDATFQKVVGEYIAHSLPGCVGSVDCVHIAWDHCPSQYFNLFKGKEGFLSCVQSHLHFTQICAVGVLWTPLCQK